MIKLPIGYSDFKEIIDIKFDFVDKSLLIKEVIEDSTKVILIARPRRFGKTLNLSMLHYFFAAEVYGESTSGLFNDLVISRQDEDFKLHQGKYPVIFLTFKDIKDGSFKSAYESLGKLFGRASREHSYLLTSSHLTKRQKELMTSMLEEKLDQASIKSALIDLIECLYYHYQSKVILLIDEYDTPIQSTYLHGYYDEMITLMRHLLGTGLKDNPYLFKSVLTGILRVSKESLFSGLNNLKVYSVLHPKYSEYFGFTQNEVTQLLDKTGLKDKTDEIKLWYNGYQVGDQILYNPGPLLIAFKNMEYSNHIG